MTPATILLHNVHVHDNNWQLKYRAGGGGGRNGILPTIDLMHWRPVSITTTPCWGSRLVALRARVVLAEHIGAQPLSQCAGPGQPGGMACRGWPAGCMLGDGTRGSASFDPQHAGAPFCDVICIWSICGCNNWYQGIRYLLLRNMTLTSAILVH